VVGSKAERTIELLWRHRADPPRRRGPRPAVDVDALVAAGIELADSDGFDGVTVRRLAERVGISRMSVYSYVDDLDQLGELMIDTVHGELVDGRVRAFPYGPRSRPPADPRQRWRRAARTVADLNLELYRRHPWLLARSNDRPVLGPHSTAKYDAELRVFAALDLPPAEMDLALWQLLNHVRGTAAESVAVEQHRESAEEWWRAGAAAAERWISGAEFPLAVAVGSAVGEAQNTAYDPAAGYRFGLAVILDGIQALIDRRAAR
jgi:AcrR family transcriptional regulator